MNIISQYFFFSFIGGHYIAYVRESHSNRWFECDDTNVREGKTKERKTIFLSNREQ